MRKKFKKLTAVALATGMLVSSFTSGIAAQEETKESKELKKGTVITDFKEIKDVSELVPGNTYFFSITQQDEEGAVASLPDGSAILKFAGTDIEEAIEAGTFLVIPEYIESYEAYRAYAFEMKYKDRVEQFPSTPEEAYAYFAQAMKWDTVPTSWEELVEAMPEITDHYSSMDELLAFYKPLIEDQYERFESEFPADESAFLEKMGFNTWDEFYNSTLASIKSQINPLPGSYAYENVQQEQQGYVAVVQRGEGFDGCPYGTIAYLTEETDIMKEQLNAMRYEWMESSFEGPGWYYGCSNSGVGYVGPFYLYSYKVNTFTADDLIVTFRDDWQEPTQRTIVTKDDFTLSIVVDGEEIIIPFYELSDSVVDPENEDTTITITVDEVEKVVDLCNEPESGEVEKDVQVGEDAPDTGFNNDVEELKEIILTEAEAKLVENGVNIDIFLTVANKDEEELGEDKTLLEEELDEDDKAVYLDLKLFKQIGSGEPKAISEVAGGKIMISIEVPDEIKEFAASARIMRVHGTEVDELDTTYDATTNKLTFETDRFSTYAIVYNESADDTGAGNDTPGSGNDTPGSGNDTPGIGNDTPGTGNDTPGTGNDTPGTGNQTPDAGDKTPETGDKAPETGDKAPETGDKAPETGDKTPETGDKAPETGDKTPETGDKAPETGDKTPETGDKTPTTENKAPGAGDSSMAGLYVAIVAIAAVAMVMRKRVTCM